MTAIRFSKIYFLFFFFSFYWPSDAQEDKSLPRPRGEFEVGYKSFFLEDSLRTDYFFPEAWREIPIQIWYPSKFQKEEKRSYVEDEYLLSMMKEELYQSEDIAALDNLRTFTTFSRRNAKMIDDRRFPLIIFSHGLGVSKQNYTVIAEELVSRGNIVVTIDHPYGGFTVTSDGRLLSSRKDSLLYRENGDEVLLERMKDWTKDIDLVLDELLSKGSAIGEQFGNNIDRSRIATIGHSLGGNVALNYASKDDRVKTAVNLDGGTFGNLEAPPRVPTLTIRSQPIYSRQELNSKGRSVDEWERMGKEIDSVFATALRGSSESYEIKIRGTGHMSFSDAPFVLPNMITRFGGKIMDFKKASDFALDFINEFLASKFYNRKMNFEEILSKCKECELKNYKDEK